MSVSKLIDMPKYDQRIPTHLHTCTYTAKNTCTGRSLIRSLSHYRLTPCVWDQVQLYLASFPGSCVWDQVQLYLATGSPAREPGNETYTDWEAYLQPCHRGGTRIWPRWGQCCCSCMPETQSPETKKHAHNFIPTNITEFSSIQTSIQTRVSFGGGGICHPLGFGFPPLGYAENFYFTHKSIQAFIIALMTQ